MKRKLLIVTLNDYIIYQPSILNLYDALLPYFDVKIISFQPEYVTKTKDDSRNIQYIVPARLKTWLIKKIDFIFSKIKSLASGHHDHFYYHQYLPGLLNNWLKNHEKDADLVIAVDIPALIVAQQVYGPVHFLSLEIENKESSIYRKLDRNKVKSVFIQTTERAEYLFPGKQVKTFIVQNAPVFTPVMKWIGDRNDFVFAGTARAVFGIFECIHFIETYPGYRLIQKGGGEEKILKKIRNQHSQLINEGRLILDNSYLPAGEFIPWLSRFRIGFCFYSWDWVRKYFNYRTAPSGKIFMYMAAGVPVIACDIPGFKVISDFNAGILVKDYEPATIKEAVDLIESDYENYSANCYKLAASLSFDKAVQPYLEYLRSEQV